MSKLEKAMADLIETFDEYAAAEGNKCTLSKSEAKTLLQKELPGLIKDAKDKDGVDKLLKGLDFNGDSEIDFQEFIVLVAAITCACHGRCKK